MRNKIENLFKAAVCFIVFTGFVMSFSSMGFAVDKYVLLMVDSSGSMGEKIEGKVKIDIAKDAVANLMIDLPDELPIGLRVYGHKYDKNISEADNCKATELLVPIAKGNKSSVASEVRRITPAGKTPIAYSLSKVPEDFPHPDIERYIILVSDGKETCGGDPIAVIKDLEAKGFKVVVHTIGFDVDAETRRQLKAISDVSGGMYMDASNSKQLSDSLKTATEEIKKKMQDEEQGAPIKPGNGFSSATPLKEDVIYKTDILPGERHYYKIRVEEGDTVEAVYTVKSNCVSSFISYIYDPDRVEAARAGLGGWDTFKPDEKRTVRFSTLKSQRYALDNGMPASGDAYFTLQYDPGSGCEGTYYTFKVRIKKPGQAQE